MRRIDLVVAVVSIVCVPRWESTQVCIPVIGVLRIITSELLLLSRLFEFDGF